MLQLTFRSGIIEWRGPAPFVFAPLPAEHVPAIEQAARSVSYGWGMIPVEATIGDVTFTTSLFPRDGSYLLPLKDKVRRDTGITVGDVVDVAITLQPRR